MIDNTEILAIDKDPIATTNVAGLVAGIGTVRYDYMYTSPITDEEFNTKEVYNPYKGYLGQNSFLVKQFSNFVLSKSSVTEEIGYMEEFGPVAREIIKISSRITSGDNTPAIPRYPVITMNPFATIIGNILGAVLAYVRDVSCKSETKFDVSFMSISKLAVSSLNLAVKSVMNKVYLIALP